MSQSLPLPSSLRRSGPYVAAAGQTAFSVVFPFIADADLLVQVRADDDAAWSTASLATDYAVTGAGATDGGTVTFAAPRAEGSQVQIIGLAPVESTYDPSPAGQVSSGGLNRAFDRHVIWTQETRRDVDDAHARISQETTRLDARVDGEAERLDGRIDDTNGRLDMIDGTAAIAASEVALQAQEDAETAAAGAALEREGSETAAAASSASAAQAVAARDAAMSAANLYPNTAAGLAATAVGGYFLTPGTEDYEVLFLYRVDAGPVATIVKKYVTPGSIDPAYSQSGYAYVEFGSDGNFLFGLAEGAVSNFVVEGLVELSPQNAPKNALNLGGTVAEYFGAEGYAEADRRWTLAGSDGNELGGIDGSLLPQPTGAFSPFQSARPDYVAGAGYEVFTRRDTNLRMQVYSRDLATMTVRLLSSAAGNNILPRINALGTHAIWQCDGGDRWPSDGLRSRALSGAGAVNHAWSWRYLLVAGDSVDNGSVATGGNSYAALLAAGLSLPLTMRAIGGQQAWQQAMQLGAVPTNLTVASTTIATGGTAVTAIATTHPTSGVAYSCAVSGLSGQNLYPCTLLLSTGADANTRTLYGFVTDNGGASRRVRLVRTATGAPSTAETYTLYSEAGIAVTSASTTVAFVPDNGDQLSFVASIGAGLNDLSQGLLATNRTPPSAAEICANTRALQDAIVALLPACGAYVIQGLYNPASAWAIAGGAGDLAIIDSNAIQAAKYGIRFVPRREIFLAGGDGSTQDNSDIANHYIPTSLRGAGDTIHPNNTGHALVYNGNAGGVGAYARLAAQLAAFPA